MINSTATVSSQQENSQSLLDEHLVISGMPSERDLANSTKPSNHKPESSLVVSPSLPNWNLGKSVDKLPNLNKELLFRLKLPVHSNLNLPFNDPPSDRKSEEARDSPAVKILNKKSDFLNAKLMLKSIDSKEKLKLKQQPQTTLSVIQNSHASGTGSHVPSPEKMINPSSFSLKSTYFTGPIVKKSEVSNIITFEPSSPRKFTVLKKADQAKPNLVFAKKNSEGGFKARDKSREFKISFSRLASQANINQIRDIGPGGSSPMEFQDMSPTAAGIPPSKSKLNKSFSRLETATRTPVASISRGLDHLVYSKFPAAESKYKDRLTSFSPFAIQKAWTEKEEFVIEHHRAVNRNLANRRMRILQSSMNLLEKEPTRKESEPFSPVKKLTKKKA